MERYSKISKNTFISKVIERNMAEKLNVPFGTKPLIDWNSKLEKSDEFPRNWKTTVELRIVLSDGHKITIPKGYIWDGSSIPKIIWWLFKPIDEGAIGDLIHDYLWDNKVSEIIRFDNSINKARKFSDKERLIWRNKLAPKKKIKNYITHGVIRAIGSLFYTRQINIPK